MSSSSRAIRGLAVGAALVTCSLASAANPPLSLTSLGSASGFMSLGSTTGNFTYAGPANYMSVPLAIGAGSGVGTAVAFGIALPPGSAAVDAFGAGLDTTSAYTSGVTSLTFTLTLNQAAIFNDSGAVTGFFANWTKDSAAITNGTLVAAGTYTFVGSYVYSGAAINSMDIGFSLTAAASAVPLPGAAGLAAIGLAGMSRRRRR